jgi:hypothetical protein
MGYSQKWKVLLELKDNVSKKIVPFKLDLTNEKDLDRYKERIDMIEEIEKENMK